MSFGTQTPDSCFGYSGSSGCTADKLQANVVEDWKKELVDRINIYNDSNDKFIRTFVPSRARCNFHSDTSLKRAFAKWTPEAGKEVESYDALLKGLGTVVKPFTDNLRPSFFRSHAHQMKFPFTDFATNHHNSFPDLAISLPGVVLASDLADPTWSDFSMIIEAKATVADDPFTSNSLQSCKAVVQLAVSARSLMHAHGLLAAFVLGFYGDTARIVRFDHACAVVSKPFSLKKLADLKLLQRFFWRFVNPCETVPFVGCDPTIRALDADDEKWLVEQLGAINYPVDQLVMREARWAEVYDDDHDGEDLNVIEPKPYIMFKALDVNGRLFSRATTVWMGIRDTRISHEHEDIVNKGSSNPQDASSAKRANIRLRIIKDAWRHLVHRPEKDFYDLLDAGISSEERVGLAKLLVGGDLGEREVRQWEHTLYGAPTPSHMVEHNARLSAQKTADPANILARAPRSVIVDGLRTSKSPPPHRPMQQTFSWRLSRGENQWHRERSHMRFVVDTVGRPLTSFRSTRELVEAMLDAIRGHRLAMEKAGVLHRDISVGNILIVDKPNPSPRFCGFIHDFDYSSSVTSADYAGLPELVDEENIDYAEVLNAPEEEDQPSDDDQVLSLLKGRRGTYYFMAIKLLQNPHLPHEVCDDLQSFYWVLLYVVLRHTDHDHASKEMASSDIFEYSEDQLAAGRKLIWLLEDNNRSTFKSKIFKIRGNVPLTALLDKFRRLVNRSLKYKQPLTYDAVEALFVDALANSRWPTDNDGAKTFVRPDPRTRTVVGGQPARKPCAAADRSKQQQQPAPARGESTGSKRKSKATEEPPARPAQRPRRGGTPPKHGKRG